MLEYISRCTNIKTRVRIGQLLNILALNTISKFSQSNVGEVLGIGKRLGIFFK